MKFISCGFLESDYNITPFIFSVEGSWFAESSDQKDRSRTRKKEKQNRVGRPTVFLGRPRIIWPANGFFWPAKNHLFLGDIKHLSNYPNIFFRIDIVQKC